ncbi:hypothetical protein TSUD_347610 [Trifolium subterraneum]|nr:hypothetical protein TSUD_347610 [Trifolium subterraneum]
MKECSVGIWILEFVLFPELSEFEEEDIGLLIPTTACSRIHQFAVQYHCQDPIMKCIIILDGKGEHILKGSIELDEDEYQGEDQEEDQVEVFYSSELCKELWAEKSRVTFPWELEV